LATTGSISALMPAERGIAQSGAFVTPEIALKFRITRRRASNTPEVSLARHSEVPARLAYVSNRGHSGKHMLVASRHAYVLAKWRD
jgi:hypothetical protein